MVVTNNDEGLIAIINEDFNRNARRSKVAAFDLDGTLYPINTSQIHRLVIENVLSFLSPNTAAFFNHLEISDLLEPGRIPQGIFLDPRNGVYIIALPDGEIVNARVGGSLPLSDQQILDVYTSKRIEITDNPDPNKSKDSLIRIYDAFDFIQAVFTSLVHRAAEDKRETLYQEFYRAWRLSHDGQHGFKKELAENPEKYGITRNQGLIDFLENLKQGHKKIALITASPVNLHQESGPVVPYIDSILEALGIRKYFDGIITESKKPGCFFGNPWENSLWGEVRKLGAKDPSEVVYFGDHLYKDAIGGKHMGFNTVLVANQIHLKYLLKKLSKYHGLEFSSDGGVLIPSELHGEKKQLSYFPTAVLRSVDAIVTEPHKLASLL